MNKARSSFCDYSVSSGKCHESNTSRKTSSDYHTLDNFCRLLFLHFLGQKSPASLQCVLIVLSRNWFSSPSHLSNTSRWFAASFSRYPVPILTSGIHLLLESQSCLTLCLLLLSSSFWYCICLAKSALQVLLGFRFCDKIFLTILLLIGMSWPDSNASNYVLSYFPCHFHCRCYLSLLAGLLSGTAIEFPMHIWVPEKKIVHGPQKKFTFLSLKLNTTLITWFWGKKPHVWAWWFHCQKWQIETFVSNVLFIISFKFLGPI